ncbi:hypothetical protein COV19_03835 [Candidatus Woesearchaeota archaeon CG10_big_fil_rev_8_21_14_0_10_44_13]|nr:MAG: hypothetical protein COV19_03835 [Candidatus Woesearchaeota archaeon CG10_big_fil_rev_8_21_14_0_10_44_13]
MPVRIDAIKTRVKYYGVFDFKQIYRDVRDKLTDLSYIKGDDYKYIEPYYSEKESSDPREAKTIWIWWRTKKIEENSTFYEQHIDLDFHLRFCRDMEVMVDDAKKRVWKAEIEVLMDSYVLLDPDDKWKNHWFLKTVLPLFYKRIWRKRREDRKNSTITDTYKVQAMIKDSFEMHHFMPRTPDQFFQPYGYKGNV